MFLLRDSVRTDIAVQRLSLGLCLYSSVTYCDGCFRFLTYIIPVEVCWASRRLYQWSSVFFSGPVHRLRGEATALIAHILVACQSRLACFLAFLSTLVEWLRLPGNSLYLVCLQNISASAYCLSRSLRSRLLAGLSIAGSHGLSARWTPADLLPPEFPSDFPTARLWYSRIVYNVAAWAFYDICRLLRYPTSFFLRSPSALAWR